MSMTKEDIYNELIKRGIQPKKTLRFSKIEDLQAMLEESNPKKPESITPVIEEKQTIPSPVIEKNPAAEPVKEPAAVKILPLHFETSGWCEELCCSYFAGTYHPQNAREYEALKKYAVKK